jgi:SlyX protein
MTEERLIDIETRIALQEDQIDELNKTVYQQQQKIERLEAICEALAKQVRSLGESSREGGAVNEKPPHY